jgi:hypothetical protein
MLSGTGSRRYVGSKACLLFIVRRSSYVGGREVLSGENKVWLLFAVLQSTSLRADVDDLTDKLLVSTTVRLYKPT